MKNCLFALILLLLCTGCAEVDRPPELDSVADVARVPATALPSSASSGSALTTAPTATRTSRATSTTTPTPTPTLTPSATPTPTPTAMPITSSGSPRLAVLSDPLPQAGAPCGVVDILDFPLDPPDAEGVASGGQDFGVFRRRYDKYHTGEDWWGVRRGSNFGAPVYSIGHGRVTYAAPLGWGRDQGVVILRHVFADGDTILSFYGHLDPDSVVLNAGDCVSRGDQVGQIGRPRTSPHLHFELRHHMPFEPGPGYWPEDPIPAGWEPPSQTIWGQRMGAAPGVQWTRLPTARDTLDVGLLSPNIFALIEDRQLVGLDVADGTVRWQFPEFGRVDRGMIDPSGTILYVANRSGQLQAHQLQAMPGDEGSTPAEDSLVPLWQLELQAAGAPTLMPLPGGGLLMAANRHLSAVSAEGRLLWQEELPSQPASWAIIPGRLIFSTPGRPGAIWSVDRSGRLHQGEDIAGQLIVAGDQTYIYAQTGIYHLDQETLSADLLYGLPDRYILSGEMAALPGGGLLVAHADLDDRRLIVLYPDGRLRWDRSIAAVSSGQLRLQMLDGRAYLFTQTNLSSSTEYKIYWVDIDNARLRLIFTGGTRSSVSGDTWVLNVDQDRLLFNIGGGHMLAFQPRQAIEAVFQTMNAR